MLMRTLKTVVIVGLIGLAVGALALENRVHEATHGPLPVTHGRITLAGLQRPVTVYRDTWGAPHIYAKTDQDAFFALGYVSAQERLFQMDFLRRVATGRLAEILGPAALPVDKQARIVGFSRIAAQVIPHMSEESRALGDAYVAGVNAYMAEATLPVEFRVLGYTPEPWTVQDSVALGRLQAWGLSANWRGELLRQAVIEERGEEIADLLLPGLETWGPYILNPEQRDYTGTQPTVGSVQTAQANSPALRDVAVRLLAEAARMPFGAGSGYASNNWVVAGSKTASGKPILANDPHLSLPMPSVWMEVRVQSPSLDVTGVMFPGLPLIPLGHNRYIAWGATTTIADTQDLYIERPHPSDPENLYVVPGGVKRYRVDVERIVVKGGGPGGVNQFVDLRVRISRHGPIINDLVEGLPAGTPPLALRWAAAEPTDDAGAFLDMMRATNWAEFKAAVDTVGTPIQNWVFAGIDGDIGYVAAGLIPVRKPGHDPRVPAPGHTDANEWIGWIPSDELPWVLNPPAGYVGSANNKVVPPAYPYHIQDSAAPPYRAARIQELLADATDLTVADMQRMQMDDYMIAGRRITPAVLKAVQAGGTAGAVEAAALDALQTWDFRATEDSVGTTVFHAVIDQLSRAVAADEVSSELYEGSLGPFGGLGGLGLLDRMCSEGFASILWDDRRTEAIETPQAVLAQAFRAAVEELTVQHGRDVRQWAWGRVHRQTFSHLFARVRPGTGPTQRNAEAKSAFARLGFAAVDHYFGSGPYAVAGTGTTLRASPNVYAQGMYDAVWGVSWRHVIDMADVSSARGVLTTGNSGHVASSHYRDQIPLWLAGEYHPMIMDFEPGEIQANRTLVLLPAPAG